MEYRLWNPYRSKLSAAIINGLKGMRIAKGSHVLYLGAATGTTVSHVSDIVSDSGRVYAIELSSATSEISSAWQRQEATYCQYLPMQTT